MPTKWTLKYWISFFSIAAWAITAATAQTFSSGSTGADGPFTCTNATNVQLPPSGVLNYTTVNVPSGCSLAFLPNLTNTPVTILATGAVTIVGSVYVGAPSGGIGAPGPGGFWGGAAGSNGIGPGGGIYGKTDGTQNGQWVGPLNLVPIIGGSGGAGGGSAGGGGGGAIVIASSTSITVTGNITANASSTGASSGANGAVRLVANAVNVSGYIGATAVVRLEGPTGSVVYNGNGTPPVITTINPVIVPVNPPGVAISSIGGYPAPSATTASWRTVDLLLPTQLSDPLAVIVQGTNLPVGSQVSLSFSGSTANANPPSTTLSGSSATTFYVSGLNRAGVTVIFAVVSFNPALIAGNLKQSGPDAVAKLELAAAIGQPTKYRFLRADGSEVTEERVAPELRGMLGR